MFYSTQDEFLPISQVAKAHGWSLEGWWFRPQDSRDEINAVAGPLSKGLNPTLPQLGLNSA